MNSLTNNILKEAEDSSDDFFQSKHINRRKKQYKKQQVKKTKEVALKLIRGLKNIVQVYKNKDLSIDRTSLIFDITVSLLLDIITDFTY